MTQTLETIHPDIRADLDGAGRVPVEVIDPSPGLWGGEPVPGLVTIVYVCSCEDFPKSHTHHALYGPRLVATCGAPHVGCQHDLVPSDEPGFTIYAD